MTMQPYLGNHLIPGAGTRYETVENVLHWGPAHLQQWMAAPLISNTARDAGNTGTTRTLRSGLALGKVTLPTDPEYGKLMEWDSAATNGSQYLFGFLEKTLQLANALGTETDRYTGRVMIAGNIRSDRVLMPGNTDFGLSGDDQYALTAQMNGRFLIDSLLPGNNLVNSAPVSKTADYTIVEADNGAKFDNLGAAGTVIFTLPTTAKAGLKFTFFNVAGEIITVSSGSANIYQGTAKSTFNIGAASLSGVTLEGDGVVWRVS